MKLKLKTVEDKSALLVKVADPEPLRSRSSVSPGNNKRTKRAFETPKMGGRDDDPGSAVEDDLLISDEDSQEDEDGDLETEGGDEHGHGGGHGGAAHARTAHGTGTHPRTPGSGSGNASKRARGKRRAGDGDERRAKTRRACLACQRAHLTCDDKRPCSRCEKRGLADTCTDGFRKKAKYLADIDDDGGLVTRESEAYSLVFSVLGILPRNSRPWLPTTHVQL